MTLTSIVREGCSSFTLRDRFLNLIGREWLRKPTLLLMRRPPIPERCADIVNEDGVVDCDSTMKKLNRKYDENNANVCTQFRTNSVILFYVKIIKIQESNTVLTFLVPMGHTYPIWKFGNFNQKFPYK